MCNHKADLGIDAECHFFVTSHGKRPCDGLGGTVKRLEAKASLPRPYNEQLFDFVRENISGINTVYCSMDDWKKADILEDKFYNSTTIIGTQKLYSFIPVSWTEVEIKTVSIQYEGKVVRITKHDNIEFKDLKGLVTAMYDRNWWLGCVLDKYPDSEEIKVIFFRTKRDVSVFLLSITSRYFSLKIFLA